MTEFTERTPRVVAARKLTRRAGRDAAGEFLAEGPQAVREALAFREPPRELFVTAAAADRHPELVAAAYAAGVPVSPVTDRAAAALSETATPQGLVAVCRTLDVPLHRAWTGAAAARPADSAGPGAPAQPSAGRPAPGGGAGPAGGAGSDGGAGARLVVVLADIRDPGNAGTVLRSADAAGADAVVFAGDSVDPYNGKAVRAGAGSLFHLPVVRGAALAEVLAQARAHGLTVLAADGAGERDLDDLPELAGPTAWLFGNEAWGLPADVGALADARVRIPISPRAESLNLAAAAAVCLFASARAHRLRTAAATGANV